LAARYGKILRQAIPLLAEEGWLRHQKMERSHRSGAGGVVRPAKISAELTTPALRATPPLRGGE